jgi:hypothetical protein
MSAITPRGLTPSRKRAGAGRLRDARHVREHVVAYVNGRGRTHDFRELLRRERGLDRVDRVAVLVRVRFEHRHFGFRRGMADRAADEESIELRLGQAVRAVAFHRVLRGDHDERRLE